ncbi:MAG: hypothetical protein ACU836_08470 [Gammaproteobacteria bacterium]
MQRRLIHYIFLVASAGVISACSFQAPPLSEGQQIEKLRQFIGTGGYSPAREYRISWITESWLHGDQTLEVSLTVPVESGTYPVVVYLPGVGEDASAGCLWRENWAKAGYLVFTVQTGAIAKALVDLKPLSDIDDKDEADEDRVKRRRADSLRGSELRYRGHQLFSEQALKVRIEQLLWAYDQFKRRAASGQAWFAKADLSRQYIAGYDAGAQTVAAFIGENVAIQLPSTDLKPQAAILISPMVDPAKGNIDHRYRNIHIPFLAITAETDNDPYGISSPRVRTAVWEYASGAQHYLLLLKNADHRLLAGAGWREGAGFDDRRYDSGSWEPEFFRRHEGGGAHRRSRNDEMGTPFRLPHQARVEAYRSVAAVFSVTNAFLDGIDKADNFAALWLKELAPNWLGTVGTLKSR